MDDWSILRPDPQNARKHTARNRQLLASSLAEVGAARSIVIDEDGTILAGNATAEAARKKGLKLQIIDTEGDTLVAVRRSGLSPAEKTRLALYDNRAAEVAEWDVDVLAGLRDDGVLDGLWSADEIGDLSSIEFPEYDESAAHDVKKTTCPHCGHAFPI